MVVYFFSFTVRLPDLVSISLCQFVLRSEDLIGGFAYPQVNLFRSISPMFRGKPRLIVCSKCDLTRLEDLDEEKQVLC